MAILAEATLIAGTGVLATASSVPIPALSSPALFIALPLLGSVFVTVLLYISGAYTVHSLLTPKNQLRRVCCACSAFFFLAAVYALLSSGHPADMKRWLVNWFGAEITTLSLFRFVYSAICRYWNRAGQLSRRAVLVGGGTAAAELLDRLESGPRGDVTIVGIFDDRAEQRSPRAIAGYPKLGTIKELLEFARNFRVDLLLVTLPIQAEERLHQMLRKLWVLPVDIRLSAHTQKFQYHRRSYSRIGNVPFLDLSDKPITGWNAVIKAVEDRMFAVVAICLLAPVMAIVWLAVKLDSKGPALFKQARYGFNNELINIYKFRTMFVDKQDHSATKLTTRNDPRVTRVGRFLRKTSLDELPQLFNVLKGEISMVGPRPQAPMAGVNNTVYAEIVEEYFARTRVKPGITGWAQINGWRGNTDTPEKIQRRVEHDLYYIENWSLFFDLYILARTPFSLLNTENAY